MAKIPDSDGLFHQGLKGKKPYLGAPSVVDRLIRGVLTDVNNIRGRQLAGENIDVAAEFKAIATRFQDIFYGKTQDYETGFLHKPNVLGHMLTGHGKMGGSDEDAVYRLCFHLINSYLKDYRAYEDDQISDGEMQLRLQQLVTQYTHILTAGGRTQ
jgi:hypothetical protein